MARSFGPLPRGTVKAVGYGAGTKDTEGAPNLLRVILMAEEPGEGLVIVVEAQVDDATPEYLAGALDYIRTCGALDVFVTPVLAKKGRPGWTVSVICEACQEGLFADLLLEHTTTIGVRYSRWERRELPREVITLDTPHGPIRVKVVTTPSGRRRSHPEWDDIKALADKAGLSPLQLLQEIGPYLILKHAPPAPDLLHRQARGPKLNGPCGYASGSSHSPSLHKAHRRRDAAFLRFAMEGGKRSGTCPPLPSPGPLALNTT